MPGRLHGIRALVTRPAAQAGALCTAIRAQGGEAFEFQLLEIEPLPAAAVLAQLREIDRHEIAIFVSANAVRAACEQLHAAGIAWPAGIAVLAIGSATRAALAAAGIEAAAGSLAMDSEELLRQPGLADVNGKRIVLLKGEGGRGLLAQVLRGRGAEITECILFSRRPVAGPPGGLHAALAAGRINAILVASGETLQTLLGLLRAGTAGTINTHPVLVVPGQRVAGIAASAGFADIECAQNATDAAMLDALARIAPRLRTGTETG